MAELSRLARFWRRSPLLVDAASGLAIAITTGPACGGSYAGAPSGDDASVAAGESKDEAGGGTPNFGVPSDGTAPVKGPAVDGGCATAAAEAKRQPVYVLFVLDGSDSMRQENKWVAVVPALKSIFTEMYTAADPGVAAGLLVFPDKGGPFPSPRDVPVGFVDAMQNSALDTRLTVALSLGTPTESALKGGYAELEQFLPTPPVLTGGKKVLVLITDGVPTDACSTARGLASYPSNPCVALAGAKLSEASPQGPIETFVVGVGDFPSKSAAAFDPKFLGYVAQAGGTGAANCDPSETATSTNLCYFEIDPSKSRTATDLQQQFEMALDAIRGQVASCTFPLQSTGLGMIDPARVNVDLDGEAVLQDPSNGWAYDHLSAPTAIVFNGAACIRAKSALAKVSIVVGCATEVAK